MVSDRYEKNSCRFSDRDDVKRCQSGPCKRMKRNVWRSMRTHAAGLSSPGTEESVVFCDRDGVYSYYSNKTLCSLVNCWFFQVRNIQYNDFRNSLKVVRPSLSPHSLKFFEEWNSLYGSSA